MLAFVPLQRNHIDRIPRTPVQKGAFGTFACAQLTANAEKRIDLNASEGGVFLIGYPDHAVFNRTIINTGGGAGTARTGFVDHRDFTWFAFTWGGQFDRFAVFEGIKRHGWLIVSQEWLKFNQPPQSESGESGQWLRDCFFCGFFACWFFCRKPGNLIVGKSGLHEPGEGLSIILGTIRFVGAEQTDRLVIRV